MDGGLRGRLFCARLRLCEGGRRRSLCRQILGLLLPLDLLGLAEYGRGGGNRSGQNCGKGGGVSCRILGGRKSD